MTVIALFTLTIFGLSAPKTAAMVEGFKHFVLLQRGHHTGILAPDVVASLIARAPATSACSHGS